MHINNNFKLTYFGDAPYLVPFGQAGANLLRPIRLNRTGVFIWKLLVSGATEEKIFQEIKNEFNSEDKNDATIKKDIDNFIFNLRRYQIILHDEEAAVPFKEQTSITFSIAGIKIQYEGPAKMFSENFKPFCESFPSEFSDLRLFMRLGNPAPVLSGKLLIKKNEFSLIETDDYYICKFPPESCLQEWRLCKDIKQAYMYCKRPFWDTAADEVFHATRHIFLVLAQQKGFFAVHSASLLYRDRAWLFCGHSGAGKTTHVNLWKENFNAPLLNGDLNLLKVTDNGSYVYGLPWCGTSNISTNRMYKLGGITFLKQFNQEQIVELNDEDREFYLLLRLISPAWTEDMFQKNIEFVKSLPDDIPMFQLLCTKNPEAAIVMRQAIESCI